MSGSKKKPRSEGNRRSGGRAAAGPGGTAAGSGVVAVDPAVIASGPSDAHGTGDLAVSMPLRGVRLALVGLALAGFLISFYLTLTHYRNLIPPCYGTTGCETVITSRYAVIWGIPLSLAGAVYFAVMFYMGIALLTTPDRRVLRAYELFAYAGLLVAICLFLLQALVLEAYCTYCLTTEVIALLLWGGSFLLTSRAKREPGSAA